MTGDEGSPAAVPSSGTQSSAWAIRALVEHARFTPVRLREGYDMAEVDRLLDEVVAAAERGEPVASVVDDAKFTAVRLREGYDMAEVDRLLAQLKGSAPATIEPAAIPQQRGRLGRFLDRL